MSAVVIGGGVAGAATAGLLARAGREVVLLERTRSAQHKVCGEFISAETTAALGRLGIDLAALGAVAIDRLRLHRGAAAAEIALPFAAASLSRRQLDEALLRRAAGLGATIHRGIAAKEIAAGGVRLASGERVPATAIVLATGKHELRGATRATAGGPLAFKMHLRLRPEATASLRHAVEIFLFPGGYAGLELVERGVANLCLVCDAATYAESGRCWEALLDRLQTRSRALATRLEGAQPAWPRPLAVASLPYGFLHHGPDRPGLHRVGDQFAVVPSFTGAGLAIALRSAERTAAGLLEGLPAPEIHSRLRREIGPRLRRARLLSHVLERPLTQPLAVALARLAPPVGALLARATRLPDGDWRFPESV